MSGSPPEARGQGRFSPGALVRCREREWVVLPSPDPQLLLLRPLGGGAENTGIYLPLVNLGLENVEAATFPPPDPERAGDFVSAQLLWQAARLSLRDGAGPFRSLGRISVRPRPYQYVPLLMALRLSPVRLLIADDVGIGKTIEGALIARELLDRGEIDRVCVLCPPYLTDQWQRELAEKFHIEAVVIRSGTAARLERRLPRGDESVFSYFPHVIVSIDYAKSPRHLHALLHGCPNFVIVDEAHGCARPPGQARVQQQRYRLLQRLASKPERHLILLTATPHSGVEESFLSLLGLLKPEFEKFDLNKLTSNQRDLLAQHFVQRRRADVIRWLGQETRFPKRDSKEVDYSLSPEYRKLFLDVWNFARGLVCSAETMAGWRKRLRYWAALALLRCVMSSPAAAEAALQGRLERLQKLEGEAEAWSDDRAAEQVYDRTYETAEVETNDDIAPASLIEEAEEDLSTSERRRLREFARTAAGLRHSPADRKLEKAVEVVEELVSQGYHPIVWCRYIATSNYVAEALERRLSVRWPDIRVISVTGELPEGDRQARVEELARYPRRVLVATDCLSEGINLQEYFTAVVHYDLPWNPNRLEQREGRVDRFGQKAAEVKAVILYGRDNPIDGAVLDVLLRKARKIHRTLRIYVPVPRASERVMEAVLKALMFRSGGAEVAWQPTLFEESVVQSFHLEWDRDAERERESRSRFAQRAIKPDEVRRELEESDKVLEDPRAVEEFVKAACDRLGVPFRRKNEKVWVITTSALPALVRSLLGEVPDKWQISFDMPAPEGVTPVGRNHPLVAALSEYFLEAALNAAAEAPPAARCGVIRTDAVSRRITLLVLRLRFLLEEQGRPAPILAEEAYVAAFRGPPAAAEWLSQQDALSLMAQARPRANVSPEERREFLEEALGWLSHPDLQRSLSSILSERGLALQEAHRRVRRLTKKGRLRVVPHEPPDVLGLYVLLPIPAGVKR